MFTVVGRTDFLTCSVFFFFFAWRAQPAGADEAHPVKPVYLSDLGVNGPLYQKSYLPSLRQFSLPS